MAVEWGGGLARSHGIVFSSAAGGAHWPIAIRCPSHPFPSVEWGGGALVKGYAVARATGLISSEVGKLFS